jgi:dTDP-4-dehydrorhamnose reductase
LPGHARLFAAAGYTQTAAIILLTMLRLARERDTLRVVNDQFLGLPTCASGSDNDPADDPVMPAALLSTCIAGNWSCNTERILPVAASGVTSRHGFATAIIEGTITDAACRVNTVEPKISEALESHVGSRQAPCLFSSWRMTKLKLH